VTESNSGKQQKLYYFEDFSQGDENPSVTFAVTKDEVIAFAKTWDPQPFHTDEGIAKASHFGGLTACSAHIFSIYCAVAQNWEDGGKHVALASLGFDEMRMLKPVYAGDTLRHTSTVEGVRESKSNPSAGIVMTRSLMVNQNSEPVFSIKCAFLMQKRSALG
jgi:acyl dehydratase